ncbi:hypothetical protein BD779DRAFT_1787696 [Infundibulicybe gibba]|nr:hypothetical protein BD779DRAFT_1787696 [Infundibulicybe gibba]
MSEKPRTRYVFNEWHRDPHGELLPKPPPKGTRTPDGIVWGHTLNDFFWIRRLPGVNVMTIWSRSMIKEFGENHLKQADRPEPRPRRFRPWPVLRLPPSATDGHALGLIDETCDSTHSLEPKKLPDIPEETAAPETNNSKDTAGSTPVEKNLTERTLEVIDNQTQEANCAADTSPCPADGAQTTASENNDVTPSRDQTPTPDENNAATSSIVMITPSDLEDSDHVPPKSPRDKDQQFIGTACAQSEHDAVSVIEQGSLAAPHVNPESTGATSAENNLVLPGAKLTDSATQQQRHEASQSGGTKSDVVGEVPTSSQTIEQAGPTSTGDEANIERPAHQQVGKSETTAADSNVKIKEKLIPKLEEFIPEEYFPDILLVNDPSGYAYIDDSKKETEQLFKYKRVWPRFKRDTERETSLNTSGSCPSTTFDRPKSNESPKHNVAHLNLASASKLGTGHHSVVRRAPLRLPQPLMVDSPTQEVTVAVKMATDGSEARGLLNNEGRLYNSIPQHLMEDWCGLNLVAPMIYPVPATAIAPKFYGFYIPVREEVERERRHKKRELKEKAKQAARAKRKEKKNVTLEQTATTETNGASGISSPRNDETEDDSDDSVDEIDDSENETEEQINEIRKDQLSPILLLEECGSPIFPKQFSPDDRSACYSMLLRLHQADIAHNSFYIRNVLVQPGPLTLPPSLRSTDTPSFRLIDFGRSDAWSIHLEKNLRTKVRGYGEKDSKKQTPVDERARLQMEERIKSATTTIANEWFDMRDYEMRRAQEELKLVDFDW